MGIGKAKEIEKEIEQQMGRKIASERAKGAG